jgi:Tfp pilus assembly protein PilZ
VTCAVKAPCLAADRARGATAEEIAVEAPRGEPRFKKRMSCRLRLGEHDHSGIILDVSRKGLFVQTSASARIGDKVEVVLSRPEKDSAIKLVAGVRWLRRVPTQLRSVAQAGIGLQISQADEGYYALLAEALQGSAPVKGRAH